MTCVPVRFRLALALTMGGLVASSASGAEVSSNWFRTPAISPDGETIVFSHGGDLYRVDAGGGRAIPLTLHSAHETSPVWSPDGSMIAFASDRAGNFDVYVMPAEGGEARRLTYYSADDLPTDFAPDSGSVIFESARRDDPESVVFPTGVLAELYRVPVEGGTPDRMLTTPAINARFRDRGDMLLYEDRKGYEDPLRKHHNSSIARDIWLHDVVAGTHTKLTDFAGEDRDPHWSADGKSMVFLSERGGDFNVFRAPLEPGAEAEQLTFFQHHPVRELSSADNGTLAFSWHGEIHRMRPGGEPERVEIEIGVDSRGREIVSEVERRGATEFAVSPSGKEIAFVLRGEVFATSVDFGTTRRVTTTPEQERSVDFSPDGRSLVYASERDGSWNVYESSLADEDELYFFSATAIEERPLAATEEDEFQPTYSPDGERIAYLENRTELKVMEIESGETVTALPGDAFYSYSDGDYWYAWSPDGSHLAVQFYNRGRAFVSEVGLVRSDGTSDEAIDLSKSGYDDNRPKWAMDGEALIWASARYGERAHGSWGAEYDVMGAFLTQDAYDRFRLSKEEYTLRKELDEKRKEREEEAEASEATDETETTDDAEKAEESAEAVEFELDDLESRIVRMTIHSSNLGDFAMSPEGDRLYYLAAFEGGQDLWVRDFREESTKLLAKLDAGGASMSLSEDGATIFLLASGSLSKVDAKSGQRTPISFAAELEIDADAEREHLFEHVWRQTKQKFYRPDMHGVDWEFYREQYRPKLGGVANTRDFTILLSELLGELNASHTGARYRPGGEEGDDRTASLGVFYDDEHAGDGRRIAEIMEGGPLDKAELGIGEGMIITHIDGVPVEASRNFYAMLEGKAGQRVRLRLRDGQGESMERVVRPVSIGAENQLRYERWTKSRREFVEEISGGRIGYVHVRGMNDASFRDFYSDTLGRHFDKDALIVDTRFNGGGWLHDDLVTFLTGKHYVDLHSRNVEAPDVYYFGEPARRWTKPSAVVMSEGNYSDAHFFPWAYTELEIGPTIGMPVPGTTTAVWWETLHTGDIVFGIPQVGAKGRSGEYLENLQLEPTYKVPLNPESAASGRDTQLIKAVRVLLDTVDGG